MYGTLTCFWHNASIRKKLMVFLVSLIFCISIVSSYLIWTTYTYGNKFNSTVNEYFKINMLQQNNVINGRLLAKYFEDVSMDSLSEFNQSLDSFYTTLKEIQVNSHSLEAYLLIRSIQNSFASYCDESNTAIIKQRNRGNDFQLHFYTANRINQYMDVYLSQLLELSLREGSSVYGQMAADARTMIILVSLILIVFLLLCLVFGLALSNHLTKPIENLARLSIQMSEGDLNIGELKVCTNDEVGTLTRSFNIMSTSIRNLVYRLREKAIIEKRLHKEELKNVKTQELLKEARFLALQSQINPHFLFNTLNTISRVITFSRTEEAIKLINALASILRYNMGNSKFHVTLNDELEIVKHYLFIQQYRFGDRLKVDIDCSGINTNAVITPCFTLQPIVENAIIHGIEPKVEGGRLRIKAYMDNGRAIIKVIDNGVGIKEEKIKSILSMKNQSSGHTSSIGLANVMSRLAIFCGEQGCFELKSKCGLGSIVVIRIPVKEAR